MMLYSLWAEPAVPPALQTRLDTLKRQAEAAEDRGNTNYASQRRRAARILYAGLGMAAEHLPEWAEERPRGNNVESHDERVSRHVGRVMEQEKETTKAMGAFEENENSWRCNQETLLQEWYWTHGPAFMNYLSRCPQFDAMDLWSGLAAVATTWGTRNHAPLPCPPPPACGRSDFLRSLPPGTPDLGRHTPGQRQVLADELELDPTWRLDTAKRTG